MNNATVHSLYIYPVKSFQGIKVPEIQFDSYGIKFDRRWLLVDEDGQFLTQREFPLMAQIKVDINEFGDLYFDGPLGRFCLITHRFIDKIKVKVWGHDGMAYDCGNTVAEYFTNTFGFPCRLVHLFPEFLRMNKSHLLKEAFVQTPLSFQDSEQILVVSLEELDFINKQLLRQKRRKISINRFRANIVVKNFTPSIHIKSKELELEFQKKCGRCIVVTTDQKTGVRKDPTVLKVLAEHFPYPDGKGATFGYYYSAKREGKLRKGSILYST